MAVTYWDDTSTSTNTTTTYAAISWSTDSTSTTSPDGWVRIYHPPPKQVLVTHPEGWNGEDRDAFIRLVNSETNTGWKVTMTISGDIEIVDPTIDVRSMKDFIPLLKQYASGVDRETINNFFTEHSPED